MGGRVLAHEVVSEEDHATYLYKVGPDVNRDVRAINRAIIHLSFKREAIYASAADIEGGRLSRYRVALRKLPSLRLARQAFLGRAIHSSEGGWTRAVQEALGRCR
jgi:hypothetical protein